MNIYVVADAAVEMMPVYIISTVYDFHLRLMTTESYPVYLRIRIVCHAICLQLNSC